MKNLAAARLAIVAVMAFAGLYHSVATVHASSASDKCDSTVSNPASREGMVWVPGGTFMMGSDETYPEERVEHEVTVDGFWMDVHEVTNAQFARFVEETGYVTVAERTPDPELIKGAPEEMFKPGSIVFISPSDEINSYADILQWWSYVPGANWRHPEGPESNIENKDDYPVVHIAYEDAAAYAKWLGRELPTEAQFELAARSQREGEKYAWGGDELAPDGKYKANTWQGVFPLKNTAEDGYKGVAPVGSYDANDYGVYDLIGNVWEWTTNWYRPEHNPEDGTNPKGPGEEANYDPNQSMFPTRVIKGGSYLCAPNFCRRYRPAARHAQDTGIGTNHIGFRAVLNPKP